jgi:acyl-CoA thioesterase-1
LASLVAASCGGAPEAVPAGNEQPKDSPTAARATILMIGTSLTAGYGLDPDQAWPALIQAKVDSAALPYRVVNAGVSGETSAGARRRLGWLLQRESPRLVVLETGANDGLRGQSLDSLEANLSAILAELAALVPRPTIFVAGMEALPNLGAGYTNRFRAIFPRVARAHGAEYLPFLLEGVAGNARFNQADGIHPNAEGSRLIADRVWEAIEPALR